MGIVEILDSENIHSDLENWQNECEKFRRWYFSTGAKLHVKECGMQLAYQKIEPKKQIINNLYKLLS